MLWTEELADEVKRGRSLSLKIFFFSADSVSEPDFVSVSVSATADFSSADFSDSSADFSSSFFAISSGVSKDSGASIGTEKVIACFFSVEEEDLEEEVWKSVPEIFPVTLRGTIAEG